MQFQPSSSNETRKPALKKNARVRYVLERIFTYLWALASILLILTAIYLALRGNGR